MADIRDIAERWDGHTGSEVEKFLKQELAKKQAALRLGAGLERGENGVLYVVIGTEAPVTKFAGGLGLTAANGLSLALGNGALKLTDEGLIIGTSDTVAADGRLSVRFGKGLTSDTNGLKVDYGTGLKLSGNKLIVDPDALPSSGGWSMQTDGTLKFDSDGETLGVDVDGIAGGGLGKSSTGMMEVLLGTEAPVKKASGGLGLTNAGGLSLALGNAVLKLVEGGLSIGTSNTVTDAGGQLAVAYGKGLTSDYNGLKVDYGTGLTLSGNKLVVDPDTLPSGGWGKKTDGTLKFGSDGETLGVNCGAGLTTDISGKVTVALGGGLEINSSKIKVKYSTAVLKMGSDGLLDVDIDKLKTALGLIGPM